MMRNRSLWGGLLLLGPLALLVACGGDDDGGSGAPAAGAGGSSGAGGSPGPGGAGGSFPAEAALAAITTYKGLTHAIYEDSLAGAKALEAAVGAFVAAPAATTFQAAKDAWVAARVPYNQNDAFRFYDGPIDNEESGPEYEINGWPLDENYVDYTRDEPLAGIVNDAANYPDITPEKVLEWSGVGGEEKVSAGYHAMEFLLWGQDDLAPGTGAGKRPHTDYVDGGTAQNQGRRRAYLAAVAKLLVTQLEAVEGAWEPDAAATYGAAFGTQPAPEGSTGDAVKDAIANVVRGLGSLAKAELSGERMTVAYKNRGQEDEHSCFSDMTWPDLYGNALGIQNVWLGQYKGQKLGPGLDEVYRAVDPTLAAQITTDLGDVMAKMKALADNNAAEPFDVIIAQSDGAPGRTRMLDAIKGLKKVADGLAKGASTLGLTIRLEEPSEEI